MGEGGQTLGRWWPLTSVTTPLKAIDTEDLGRCWEGKIGGTRHRVGVALQLSPGELPGSSYEVRRRGFPTWLKLASGHFSPGIEPLLGLK